MRGNTSTATESSLSVKNQQVTLLTIAKKCFTIVRQKAV